MPSGGREVRVPENLGIIMSMEIDESRRDNHARGVDLAAGVGAVDSADSGNDTVFDSDIAAKARHPRSIDDHSIFDCDIEFRHQDFLSGAKRGQKMAMCPRS